MRARHIVSPSDQHGRLEQSPGVELHGNRFDRALFGAALRSQAAGGSMMTMGRRSFLATLLAAMPAMALPGGEFLPFAALHVSADRRRELIGGAGMIAMRAA